MKSVPKFLKGPYKNCMKLALEESVAREEDRQVRGREKPRCVLRRRKDWHLSLPPHNVEEFSGGGGTGPPPHKSGEYFGGEGQALFLTMSVRSTTTCWLCRSAIARCGAVCEGVRGRSRTRSATVGTLR